jgi:hypothetical protein
MHKTVKLVLFFLILILLIVFGSKARVYLEVDKCLDSGGSYDYKKCECSYISNHPFLKNHKCY